MKAATPFDKAMIAPAKKTGYDSATHAAYVDVLNARMSPAPYRSVVDPQTEKSRNARWDKFMGHEIMADIPNLVESEFLPVFAISMRIGNNRIRTSLLNALVERVLAWKTNPETRNNSRVAHWSFLADNLSGMPPSPDIGDAILEQAKSLLEEIKKKKGFAAAAELIFGIASSPEDRALLLAGMEAAALIKDAATQTTRPAMSAAPPAQAQQSEAQAFAAAIKPMNPTQRRAAIKRYYSQGKDYTPKDKNNWLNTKGKKRATPEMFLAWLDVRFPDRGQTGMLMADLQYLDPPAYDKLDNWSRKGSIISKTVIESFGLPSKIIKRVLAAVSEFLSIGMVIGADASVGPTRGQVGGLDDVVCDLSREAVFYHLEKLGKDNAFQLPPPFRFPSKYESCRAPSFRQVAIVLEREHDRGNAFDHEKRAAPDAGAAMSLPRAAFARCRACSSTRQASLPQKWRE